MGGKKRRKKPQQCMQRFQLSGQGALRCILKGRATSVCCGAHGSPRIAVKRHMLLFVLCDEEIRLLTNSQVTLSSKTQIILEDAAFIVYHLGRGVTTAVVTLLQG